MKNRPSARKYRQPVVASESAVLGACIKYLYQIGLQPIRNNTGGFKKAYTDKNGVTRTHVIRVGKKGTGDILCCGPSGEWIEIETKREDGVMNPEQLQRREHVVSRNGVYLLVHSLEELIEGMKPLMVPF